MIRGNRVCKGTRSVITGKGEVLRKQREYRVHEKHEEWQEKSYLETDNGMFRYLMKKIMLQALGARVLVTGHIIHNIISH